MYEENTNKEQNMNSDEHNNSNMGTPDFTMKDPEPVQNQQQEQASTGAQTQGSYNWQNQQTSGNQQAQYQNSQSVQNQQCNKSRYIADVYELGFVMVETALYLDTHPDDGEALAFYADMKHQYAEAVRLYNENVGPLSFYHVTNENYWNWVATPMPWEMEG